MTGELPHGERNAYFRQAVLVQKSLSLFNGHAIKVHALFLLNQIILVLKAFELQYFLEKHGKRAGTV